MHLHQAEEGERASGRAGGRAVGGYEIIFAHRAAKLWMDPIPLQMGFTIIVDTTDHYYYRAQNGNNSK